MKFEVVFMRRSKDRDWFSFMTTLVEKMDHAAIKFIAPDGALKLFHATGRGENLQDYDDYMADHEELESFEMEAWTSPEKIWEYVVERDKLRSKYSMSQILINQSLRFFLGRVGLRPMLIRNGATKVVCPETAARFVQKFGKFTGDLDSLDGLGLREFRDVLAKADPREVKRIK